MDARDRITREEMIEMFGEAVPMVAVNLLWDSPSTKTIGELRAELRAIGRRRKHEASYALDREQGQG
jgi:hypothetical protein